MTPIITTAAASMAVAATIVGLVLHAVSGGVTAPFTTFWRAALSNTIASPIGCRYPTTVFERLSSSTIH